MDSYPYSTKLPDLEQVHPAEWAFILLKRTRVGLIAIPPNPRLRNENLPVFLAYDDSHLWE